MPIQCSLHAAPQSIGSPRYRPARSGWALAVLRNARESEALNEGLLALNFGLNSVGRQAWIGFNDRQFEGQFVWADGDLSQYTNWASMQPDDYQMNEDCVAVRGPTGYRWNDYGCDLPLPFICREEAD